MHHIDPDFLLETRGTLARFAFNPKGQVDGLLLEDGTEVHTPPHLSSQLTRALRPGRAVSVRGVRLRDAGGVLIAIAIDPEGAPRILDEGPHAPHAKPHPPASQAREAVSHEGTIQALLHGSKGQVHGALLSDGTIVRFAPHGAKQLAGLLEIGAKLLVQGEALNTEYGQVIEASALGNAPGAMTKVHKRPPPPGPKKAKGAHPPPPHPPHRHAH